MRHVSSTRHDRLYLLDMINAADAVGGFIAGHSRETFIADDMCRTAVLKKLEIMGEASRALSAELKARYPEVPWSAIISFRNVGVHAYFSLDWAEVWRTATVHAPLTREQVFAIVAAEFPEESEIKV
jgi:uncharacterized protein with HEPN domain